jgi:hypothetical protein
MNLVSVVKRSCEDMAASSPKYASTLANLPFTFSNLLSSSSSVCFACEPIREEK